MGVNTIGYLNKEYGVLDVQRSLLHTLGVESKIHEYSSGEFYQLTFEYEGESRNLSLSLNSRSDFTSDQLTYLSLGKWGLAEKIVKSIVAYFGGYYIENDCSAEDPVYLDKVGDFEESEEMKKDKKFIDLMESYDLPLTEKVKFMNFIKENKNEIDELLK